MIIQYIMPKSMSLVTESKEDKNIINNKYSFNRYLIIIYFYNRT